MIKDKNEVSLNLSCSLLPFFLDFVIRSFIRYFVLKAQRIVALALVCTSTSTSTRTTTTTSRLGLGTSRLRSITI